MNQSGRMLLEFLLGLLLAAGVLGYAPSHIRALRSLLTMHRLAERESGCEREVVAAFLLGEEPSELERRIQTFDCSELLRLSCEESANAAFRCKLLSLLHPARPPLPLTSGNLEINE